MLQTDRAVDPRDGGLRPTPCHRCRWSCAIPLTAVLTAEQEETLVGLRPVETRTQVKSETPEEVKYKGCNPESGTSSPVTSLGPVTPFWAALESRLSGWKAQAVFFEELNRALLLALLQREKAEVAPLHKQGQVAPEPFVVQQYHSRPQRSTSSTVQKLEVIADEYRDAWYHGSDVSSPDTSVTALSVQLPLVLLTRSPPEPIPSRLESFFTPTVPTYHILPPVRLDRPSSIAYLYLTRPLPGGETLAPLDRLPVAVVELQQSSSQESSVTLVNNDDDMADRSESASAGQDQENFALDWVLCPADMSPPLSSKVLGKRRAGTPESFADKPRPAKRSRLRCPTPFYAPCGHGSVSPLFDHRRVPFGSVPSLFHLPRLSQRTPTRRRSPAAPSQSPTWRVGISISSDHIVSELSYKKRKCRALLLLTRRPDYGTCRYVPNLARPCRSVCSSLSFRYVRGFGRRRIVYPYCSSSSSPSWRRYALVVSIRKPLKPLTLFPGRQTLS